MFQVTADSHSAKVNNYKTNACSQFEIYINNEKLIVERYENWQEGGMAGTRENHINGSLWSVSPDVTNGRLNNPVLNYKKENHDVK